MYSKEIGTKMSTKKFLIFPFLVFGIHFFNATVSHMIVCVNFSVKFMYAVVWEVTRLHNSGRKHDSNSIESIKSKKAGAASYQT